MEGDSKHPRRSRSENFSFLRAPCIFGITKYDNLVRPRLRKENISIRCNREPSRHLEVRRVYVYLEPLGNSRKKAGGGRYFARRVPCRFRRVGRRKLRLLPVRNLS